ncbi:MAG: hypothetical protein HC790_10425 [Acaryochloridaceae cyanobacterium CSU_3_4]|nr:hypothetical protein [Acaryochloridaceae cyanobacterium CSU_3_4]
MMNFTPSPSTTLLQTKEDKPSSFSGIPLTSTFKSHSQDYKFDTLPALAGSNTSSCTPGYILHWTTREVHIFLVKSPPVLFPLQRVPPAPPMNSQSQREMPVLPPTLEDRIALASCSTQLLPSTLRPQQTDVRPFRFLQGFRQLIIGVPWLEIVAIATLSFAALALIDQVSVILNDFSSRQVALLPNSTGFSGGGAIFPNSINLPLPACRAKVQGTGSSLPNKTLPIDFQNSLQLWRQAASSPAGKKK